MNCARPVGKPGDVIRLSVAVLVDEAAAANLDLAQVRELIAVAAGVDAGCGDRVTVAAMAMRTAAATSTDNAVAQPGTESSAALWTALIAAVLILLTCAALLAVRKQRRRAAAADRRELLRAQLHIQRTPVSAAAAVIATALDEDRRQQRAVGSVDPAQAAQQLGEWIGPFGNDGRPAQDFTRRAIAALASLIFASTSPSAAAWTTQCFR
jgi:flagellar M-ring protein FliF